MGIVKTNNEEKLRNIIDALSKHEDNSAVAVLEDVGTNCSDEEVRRLTAKALVERNTKDSLSIVLLQEGKGVNDLNTGVAMSTINEILQLQDKSELLNILEDANNNDAIFSESIRETARSLKALVEFS